MFMFDKNLCMTLSNIATLSSLSFLILLKQYNNYILIADGAVETSEQKSQSSGCFQLYCVRILFTEIAE